MTQEKRIDFNKLSKPANLQNSAVLRMLEEEEQRKKLGKPGLRRVEWPPTKEGTLDYADFVEQSPVQSKTRGSGEYATYQSKSPTLRDEQSGPKVIAQSNYQESQSQPSQFQEREQPSVKSWAPSEPSFQSQGPKENVTAAISSWKSKEAESSAVAASKPKAWASVAPSAFCPSQSVHQQQEYIIPVSCPWQSELSKASDASVPKGCNSRQQPKEYIVPVSCPWRSEVDSSRPIVGQSSNGWSKAPSQFEQPTADLPTLNTWKPQQQQQQQRRPQVHQIIQTPATPTATLGGTACSDNPRQRNLTVSQEVESPQLYYKPGQSSAAHLEPPATLITLRAEPPISQEPSPVYLAQPAATNAAYDGINMRGDQKWPPASVREQTEAENRARIELAKGPACRPRKVQKDYSSFFAQHAVTNNYPGYRAPPGTQFFSPAYQQ